MSWHDPGSQKARHLSEFAPSNKGLQRTPLARHRRTGALNRCGATL